MKMCPLTNEKVCINMQLFILSWLTLRKKENSDVSTKKGLTAEILCNTLLRMQVRKTRTSSAQIVFVQLNSVK